MIGYNAFSKIVVNYHETYSKINSDILPGLHKHT